MTRAVFWSADALADLDAAIATIAERNPTAARSVLADIRKAGDNLGARAIGRPGRVLGTYERSITNRLYIIAYAIDRSLAGGERVVILRVIHTARDWPRGGWPQSD